MGDQRVDQGPVRVAWGGVNDETLVGKVVSLPKREDVPIEINELFVVEVCSR